MSATSAVKPAATPAFDTATFIQDINRLQGKIHTLESCADKTRIPAIKKAFAGITAEFEAIRTKYEANRKANGSTLRSFVILESTYTKTKASIEINDQLEHLFGMVINQITSPPDGLATFGPRFTAAFKQLSNEMRAKIETLNAKLLGKDKAGLYENLECLAIALTHIDEYTAAPVGDLFTSFFEVIVDIETADNESPNIVVQCLNRNKLNTFFLKLPLTLQDHIRCKMGEDLFGDTRKSIIAKLKKIIEELPILLRPELLDAINTEAPSSTPPTPPMTLKAHHLMLPKPPNAGTAAATSAAVIGKLPPKTGAASPAAAATKSPDKPVSADPAATVASKDKRVGAASPPPAIAAKPAADKPSAVPVPVAVIPAPAGKLITVTRLPSKSPPHPLELLLASIRVITASGKPLDQQKSAIKALLNQFNPTDECNALYGEIWVEAGKPTGDPDYGRNHAVDDIGRLIKIIEKKIRK